MVRKKLWILLSLVLMIPDQGNTQPLVLLAGGGAEGDVGDKTAWSWHLYKKMIEHGDRTGDGFVTIAALTASSVSQPSDTSFIPSYFRWIGEELNIPVQAFALSITTKSSANNELVAGKLANCDAIFIRGGDQGDYYDKWNGTKLESYIRAVFERDGAVGGTSAGAMSMAEFCLAGGKDLSSLDAMQDSHSSMYEDATQGVGSSGIHTDFLSFLPGIFVDTHFTERGRLGRLLGVWAKAQEDAGRNNLMAIGVERQTGAIIYRDTLSVIGYGDVTVVQSAPDTKVIRTPGRPLWGVNIRLDRLVDGWKYNLLEKTPVIDPLPEGAEVLDGSAPGFSFNANWVADGSISDGNNRFQWEATYYPNDFSLVNSGDQARLPGSIGFTDCSETNTRADKTETMFMALYSKPELLGLLMFRGGRAETFSPDPDQVFLKGTPAQKNAATIILDAGSATHLGLSRYRSNWAVGGGKLKSAAILGVRVHVLSDSDKQDRQVTFNLVSRKPEGGILTSVSDDSLPHRFFLSEPFPNPFNPSTTLTVRSEKDFTWKLFDATGRQLLQGEQKGASDIQMLNLSLHAFASSVYMLSVTSISGQTRLKRLILIK